MDNIKKVIVKTLAGQEEYDLEDSEVRQDVQQIIEGAPEELDSFKEAFEAFKEGSQALQANADAITAEAKRATDAEKANADAITAEAKRATDAEKANADAITAEAKRATDAEKANADAITAEAKRATDAEKANADAITAEAKRATDAEKANAEAIAAITSGSTFRALYIAAGAEYNGSGVDKTKTTPWGETVIHKAGHYYLNGLGDITEAEMMDIYNYKDVIYRLDCPRILQNKKARTIFPCSSNALEGVLASRKLNGLYSFYGSSIEELDFHFSSQIEFSKGRLLPASESLSETFANCAKLRNIGGINCTSVTLLYNTFGGCTSLEQVRLYNVAKNLTLASSSKISKASILYIVQYAAPASAITVTLHPDAYARLANDSEIVAALEAQPLVSLASA